MTAGDVQDTISRYWTKRATSYNCLVDHPDHREAEREAWAAVWTRALPPPPLDVLDVSTGTGHVALLFDRALGWTDEHPVDLHYLIPATA